MVEAARERRVLRWMAILPPPGRAAIRLLRRIPDHIAHHEQIEPAVSIVIEPARPHRPLALATQPGAIAIERVRPHARHEQVLMAIVVEVPGGDADRVAFACYSGPGRHVGEGAVSIIPEQPVVIRNIRLGERWYRRAVHYVDVRPAVAIVVEDGNAAGHRLDQMLFPGRGVFQNHRQLAGFEANTRRRALPRHARSILHCRFHTSRLRGFSSLPQYGDTLAGAIVAEQK